MQDAEEADLGSEVARIASDLEQRLGTGMEQQVENNLLVLQRQRREFARHREDSMHVARGQKFLFTRLEPAYAGVALTAGAMPVATRVIVSSVFLSCPLLMSRLDGLENRLQEAAVFV